MWILESDGQTLEGKKKWLYPGGKFSFGRSGSTESGGFSIKNRTVSRRHLNIEIGATTPDDAAIPSKKSKLIFEDLTTKTGTTVNGKALKAGTPMDFNAEDTLHIKIGRHEEIFTIKWTPCVFCFTATKKELSQNFLGNMCTRLAPLDIKVEANYRPGVTHVINTKRNTSKGLQALIDGQYIVTPDFVDAVVHAARADTTTMTNSLHEDFTLNWPPALKYLPPRGNETTNKPDEAYSPSDKRASVFEGYTFIFYNRAQFENLLGPITGGKGKALFRAVEAGCTSTAEFVGYAKSVAGGKGLGSFEDGSEGKGVVVVRWQPTREPELQYLDWFDTFARQVALSLDLRLIDQKEFLDAILNADASVLRKPLELESSESLPRSTAPLADRVPSNSGSTNPANANATTENGQSRLLDDKSAAAPAATTQMTQTSAVSSRRAVRSRRAPVKRFKGFDDFDDDDDDAEAQEPLTSQAAAPSQVSMLNASSQALPSTQITQDRPSQLRHVASGIPSQAATVVLDELPDVDILSQLAPATTRFKKRKLDEALERGESLPEQMTAPSQLEELTLPKKKKPREEIDILEHARIQREKADEEARDQTQRLEQSLDGMDINEIRHLAVIEDMPVLRREERLTRGRDDRVGTDIGAEHGSEERWNDAWNGRKNFKRFRRRGQDHGGSNRRIHKVIVQLEEVKKRDFGIGDDYWLENGMDSSQTVGKSQTKASGSQRESQSRSQTSSKTKVSGNSRTASIQLETIDERTQTQDHAHHDESGDSDEQMPEFAQMKPKSSGGQKRAAPTATALPPSKKAKPTPTTTTRSGRAASEDNDDDGGGFKFGRRRK